MRVSANITAVLSLRAKNVMRGGRRPTKEAEKLGLGWKTKRDMQIAALEQALQEAEAVILALLKTNKQLLKCAKRLRSERCLLRFLDITRRSSWCIRYATQELLAGTDIHTLARQMGTSVVMLERHYSKLTPTLAAGQLAGG